MIFGRRKRTDPEVEEALDADALADDASGAPSAEASSADGATEADEAAEQSGVGEADDADQATDEDNGLDAYRINLEREDGPFDIDEVDLDADDITRLDFGSLVVTPYENMQMQIQIDQDSGEVQSLLVVRDNSALEVALFAAPSTGEMISQIHQEMITGTEAQNGQAAVTEGPLGPELHRVVPMTGPDGQSGYHVSRSWLAQGPRWLLRGVLMGDAAVGEELDPTGQLLMEFFCNLVVRRDERPRVPGDVIPLKVPDELRGEES
ncbi:DUF3710 domain-containing protein [Acidipropionibacterium thoenii]|uniref:DUF3710 domain-containing protein n=1 Tax=Acidipropionibacterium thoenii TaxID=1751 RepID=UPI000410D8D4